MNCRELKAHICEQNNLKTRLPAVLLTKLGSTLPITCVFITGGRLVLCTSAEFSEIKQPIPWYTDYKPTNSMSILQMLDEVPDKVNHSVEVRLGDTEIPFALEGAVIKEL